VKLVIAVLCVLGSVAHADDDPPAYQLRLDVDLPVMVGAAAATIPWFLDLGPAWCAPQCDSSRLDALDRPFAGRYHPGWTTAGTLTVAGLALAAPATLLGHERFGLAANDTVVIAEAGLTSIGVAALFETGVRRPRPFMYGTAAPLSDRESTYGSLSFFSGHTAVAFSISVASYVTLSRLHSRWRYVALGAGLATSTFVGVSRVLAGDHFPTDVIAGAAIGACIGWLVPSLHSRHVQLTGTGIAGTF
jgi:membrane-associated phospholipid phosphatase